MNQNKIILKVKEIIKKYKLKAPVNLNEVLKGEKILLKEINEKEIKNNGQKGEIWAFLVPKKFENLNNEKPVIFISTIIKKYPNSIRFTIAHELGHYYLDKSEKTSDIVYRKKFVSDPEEYKYNEFAINLLIPNKEEFKEKYKLMNKYDLADFYGIPLAAVKIFIKKNE